MVESHPLWDSIVARTKADEQLTKPKEKLFPFLVLTGTMRGYIIKKVKAPLQKVLEQGRSLSQILKVIQIVTARMPPLTMSNMMCKKTALMRQIETRFFQFCPIKQDMFKGAFKVLNFELDHDGWYQGVYDFLLEQHIMMILTGEWLPRWKNIPFPNCWNEPQPYGGENTIVYVIQQNREKIIDLLGDEWQWLKEGKYGAYSKCNPETVTDS